MIAQITRGLSVARRAQSVMCLLDDPAGIWSHLFCFLCTYILGFLQEMLLCVPCLVVLVDSSRALSFAALIRVQ